MGYCDGHSSAGRQLTMSGDQKNKNKKKAVSALGFATRIPLSSHDPNTVISRIFPIFLGNLFTVIYKLSKFDIHYVLICPKMSPNDTQVLHNRKAVC